MPWLRVEDMTFAFGVREQDESPGMVHNVKSAKMKYSIRFMVSYDLSLRIQRDFVPVFVGAYEPFKGFAALHNHLFVEGAASRRQV